MGGGKFTKPSEHSIYKEDIVQDLCKINTGYSSILEKQGELILYRPILALKIKPEKNIVSGVFAKNWRFLMFTSHHLYTLDPEEYKIGSKQKSDLIKNHFSMEKLSHIIFMPKEWIFTSFQILNSEAITD